MNSGNGNNQRTKIPKGLTGDLKTIKLIDEVLGQIYQPKKDSSNSGIGVYTKTYEFVSSTNPHPVLVKIRIWFNELSGIGTIKIKKSPNILLVAAGTYTLVQAGIMVKQALVG